MHYLWDRDLDRSLPKNIIILSLYVIVIIISFLFIRTATMITVFTKISYIRVFMRTMSMITFLKEDCDHDHSIHKNILYSSLYENYEHDHIPKRDCDHGRSVAVLTKCPIFEFLWGLRPLLQSSENASRSSQNDISKSVLTKDCDHEPQFTYQRCDHQQTPCPLASNDP